MYYYLLLHPQKRIDDNARTRRPLQDHPATRVYQLPSDRRGSRNAGRR
jgi:hypothetical protein